MYMHKRYLHCIACTYIEYATYYITENKLLRDWTKAKFQPKSIHPRKTRRRQVQYIRIRRRSSLGGQWNSNELPSPKKILFSLLKLGKANLSTKTTQYLRACVQTLNLGILLTYCQTRKFVRVQYHDRLLSLSSWESPTPAWSLTPPVRGCKYLMSQLSSFIFL